MAEIDTNPTTPIWPQRPTRKREADDKVSEDQRRRQQQKQENTGKGGDDDPDSSPHIDEYA